MRHFVISLPAIAIGWSSTGHDIISAIMKSRLSHDALRFVITNVGDGLDLLDASSWADSDDARLRYPESLALHHSHTPYRNCSSFVMARDCPDGRCVVSGIAESAMVISDPTVDEKTRKDHFKFFLHFMGDIHQPLHTGFAQDHGGVHIPLSFPPGTSLHDVWDREILSRFLGGDSEKNLLKLIDEQTEKLREDIIYRDSQRCPGVHNGSMETAEYWIDLASRIATETTTTLTCKRAYMDLSNNYISVNSVLSKNYLKANGPVVVKQLTRAAVRTAEFLEQLAHVFYGRKRAILSERTSVSAAPVAATEEIHTLESYTNRYASLRFDFDPDEILESLWTPQLTMEDTTIIIRPRQPKKPTSEIFEGVDLMRIVLFALDENDFALSYREFAEIFLRESKYSAVVPRNLPLDYLVIGFENGVHRLGIDRRVYGTSPSKQLIVRSLAYLKGMRLEGSTDSSIFMSHIDESHISRETGIVVGRHPDPLAESVRQRLERIYVDRMRGMESRSRQKGFMSAEDMRTKLYGRVQSEKFRVFYKNVNFVIHPNTIKHPSRVTRFTAYEIEDDYYLVVDPLVWDGPPTSDMITRLVSPRERSKTGKGFVKERGYESFKHHVQMYRPTFFDEMNEISDHLYRKLTKGPFHENMFILPHTDENHDYLVLHYILAPNHALSTFIEQTDMTREE